MSMFDMATIFSFFDFLSISNGVAIVDDKALQQITSTLTSNISKILPWGLGILAIYIGLQQLPRLIKIFARG